MRKTTLCWRRTSAPTHNYFYRYQPPTPAKDLLSQFWKLEKEAEKMLKGLAR
jgi:type I restriction enzyme M protein